MRVWVLAVATLACARERPADWRLVKVAGDGQSVPADTLGRFAVRVVDDAGEPVAGAGVAWRTPALGPRTVVAITDADGLASSQQLYRSHAAAGLEQVASLAPSWLGTPVYFAFHQDGPPPPPADPFIARGPIAVQRHQVTVHEFRGAGPDTPIAGVDVADAQAYCVSLGARLMTADEWTALADGSWGIRVDAVGPLQEWTSTVDAGGPVVRGGHAAMTPAELAAARPFATHAATGGPTIGFRCVASAVADATCDEECRRGCERDELGRCERGCDAGDARCCTRAGIIFQFGHGRRVDRDHARGFYERGCRGGNDLACQNLARLAQDAQLAADTPIDPEVERCKGGDGNACHALANTQVALQEADVALTYEQRACELGSAPGCRTLGFMYTKGIDTPPDHATAQRYYLLACERGNVEGCMQAGYNFEIGRGVAKDVAAARAMYERTCTGDDATGCARLGLLYRDGAGVPRDLPRAVELLGRACDKNVMSGCAALGEAYASGTGVARDPGRALTLFERACAIDDGDGCRDLGLAIRGKDDARAAKALQRACSLKTSCIEYAELLEAGRGVAADAATARGFYLDGCDRGDKRACAHVGSR